MVNRLYIKFLSLIINFIDSKNKNKIINFFKKKLLIYFTTISILIKYLHLRQILKYMKALKIRYQC